MASRRSDWAPAQSCGEVAAETFSSTGSFGAEGAGSLPAASTAEAAGEASSVKMVRPMVRFIRLPFKGFRLLLCAALTLAAAPAFPDLPKDRRAALAGLSSADTATRAEAIVWIANRGSMADAALLHERLRDESAFVRGFAEQGLWLLWARSGDADIDALMARGGEEMRTGQLDKAIATFGEVIGKRPDFAEGWNRRATAYYLAGKYHASIADCDQVLKRNARHFGALSGLGQIHMQLQEYETALTWLQRALDVNPNMVGVEFNMKEVEERLKARRGNST